MEVEAIDLNIYSPIYPKYQCTKCKHEWEADRFGMTICAFCNSTYVKWMNIAESLKSIGRFNPTNTKPK